MITRDEKAGLLFVAIGAVGAWLLYLARTRPAGEGAPEGSIASDPHTQSLLNQDIHAARDSLASGQGNSAVRCAAYFDAAGILTIPICGPAQ